MTIDYGAIDTTNNKEMNNIKTWHKTNNIDPVSNNIKFK